jgi:hypothetical protein
MHWAYYFFKYKLNNIYLIDSSGGFVIDILARYT